MRCASGGKGPSRDIKGKFNANKFKLMYSEGQTPYIIKLKLLACTYFSKQPQIFNDST